jgi:hypothetical protein
MNRIARLALGMLLIAGVAAAPSCSRADAANVVTMYKTPSCGCCGLWADHMRANGFTVDEVVRQDVAPIRQEYGVPAGLTSCHTSVVDGYVVEGHVPADVIRRLQAERPVVVGIAVPGMPLGSPGMEQLGRWEPYEVYTFDRSGPREVYEIR